MINLLTKQKQYELLKLSTTLPKVKRKNKKVEYVKSMSAHKIRGSELIEAGIIFEENGIYRTDPNKFYTIRKPVVVNHFERLKDVYINEGDKGVKKYCMSAYNVWYMQQPFLMKVKVFFIALQKFFRRKKKTPAVTGAVNSNNV